jgi:hypothetical protein
LKYLVIGKEGKRQNIDAAAIGDDAIDSEEDEDGATGDGSPWLNKCHEGADKEGTAFMVHCEAKSEEFPVSQS